MKLLKGINILSQHLSLCSMKLTQIPLVHLLNQCQFLVKGVQPVR